LNNDWFNLSPLTEICSISIAIDDDERYLKIIFLHLKYDGVFGLIYFYNSNFFLISLLSFVACYQIHWPRVLKFNWHHPIGLVKNIQRSKAYLICSSHNCSLDQLIFHKTCYDLFPHWMLINLNHLTYRQIII
jgi:hypothetical protein